MKKDGEAAAPRCKPFTHLYSPWAPLGDYDSRQQLKFRTCNKCKNSQVRKA